mmetsp:Transcript_34638/g.79293  ORF Transcript_34638/g.79293 Transcript_34638/m.79293 type:complete len:243 (+) Transcript_34638:540-1268(+)
MCSPSVFKNSGSISKTRSRLKAPTFNRSFGSIFECCVWKMRAVKLMLFTLASTAFKVASSTKSVLFSTMQSAKATCSTLSFSTPSGFSSSKCDITCLASTTVTMPSSLYLLWISSSTKNVCATGAGSAKPVVSMRIASKDSTFACSLFRAWTKSPRTVQQMQPFITSMTSSLASSASTFSSTPTSPNSFSIMAKRKPWSGDFKMWFMSVVFPEPRKPVKIVTGITFCSAMAHELPATNVNSS